MNSRKECCCCGRQITSNGIIDKHETMPGVTMGFGKYACKECSEDLDSNGLFPGEA